MTEIYLHIDARMADYIRTHPYHTGHVEAVDKEVFKSSASQQSTEKPHQYLARTA